MKKLVASLFLLSTMVVCAEESVTAIDKQVTGVNKEQLERKEIETKEMLLKNQNINTGSVELSSENLKEQQQKIKVVQSEKSALEDELSQGVEEKSFLKYIIGAVGVIALIIAL